MKTIFTRLVLKNLLSSFAWLTKLLHCDWLRLGQFCYHLGYNAISLRTQTYFRLSLVSAENNVCEPEPGNDFCDVMTFVSLWPIRFHDRKKLECSSQRIPRAVVLGLLELNCDWLKIPTSQKSFPGSSSQTLFSAETSDSRKYVCVRRLLCNANTFVIFQSHKCAIVWKLEQLRITLLEVFNYFSNYTRLKTHSIWENFQISLLV